MNLCKHTKFLALIKVNSHNEIIDIKRQDITLYLKREDLIHPNISGNKYRKLKYNIQEALTQNHDSLLTFGGAYSNHVAAVAYAGSICGLKTIGIIRGDELASEILNNPTLTFAQCHGMQFKFISRSSYREKMTNIFLEELKNQFNNFYLIPEGGTNALGVLGCQEILNDNDKEFDYICCSVGTGGTICGLINSSNENQKIIGFSSINKNYLLNDITKFVTNENWMLIDDFSFGGYGKVNNELIEFMNNFRLKYGILLDPIYTSKLVYGVLNLITNNFFKPNSKILMIHTGGHQGIFPMNKFLKNKNLTTINY